MPPADWTDLIAVDGAGEALGRVADVYVDAETGEPRFALVRTSRLGGLRHRSVLVPAHRARLAGGTLELPYAAGRVRDAPDEGTAEPQLDVEREREVLGFFGEDDGDAELEAAPAGSPDPAAATAPDAAATAPAPLPEAGEAHAPPGVPRREQGASVLLSEERLSVGWRVRAAERVRVRKVIVEEEVTLTVRVRREEIEIEREPLADPGPDAAVREEAVDDALPPDIVLHAEVPVVEMRVVPREHVRFARGVVTDHVVVESTVRREDARVEITSTDPRVEVERP